MNIPDALGRRADVRPEVSMVVRFVCVVCVPLCVRVFRCLV